MNLLPPEPWGRKLKRAREDVADLTLEQAVLRIDSYMNTSTGTLSRLESMDEPPVSRSRRALACIASLVYGIMPSEFGLTLDEVPAAVGAELRRQYAPATAYAAAAAGGGLTPSDQGFSTTIWTGDLPGRLSKWSGTHPGRRRHLAAVSA